MYGVKKTDYSFQNKDFNVSRSKIKSVATYKQIQGMIKVRSQSCGFPLSM